MMPSSLILASVLTACAGHRTAYDASREALAGSQHSIVLIVMDDVGPTENSLLPSLFGPGGLASKGVSFSQAYSWPVCSTTRAALMLGRYPRRDGIGDLTMAAMPSNGGRLPLGANTIGEAFSPSYVTAYFGKWHLGRPPITTGESMGLSATEQARVQAPLGPLMQGFEFEAAMNPDVPNSGQPLADGFYKWWRGDAGRLALSFDYATMAQRVAFLDWWALPASEPRMVWLCTSSAHNSGTDIYETPPGFIDTLTTRGDFEQCVTYLDQQLALVLAEIDLDETFVIVTSDNGTSDDARPIGMPSGFWKETTYQGGIHVPLIVAGPGISQGITSSRMVSLADVPATMAEISGVGLLPGFEDSQSFANALGSWTGTPERAFIFAEIYSSTYDDQAIVETETTFGSVHLKLKLRRVDADGTGPQVSQDFVYDLLTNPFEAVGGDPQTLPATLRNRLYAELASIPARL